MKFAKSLFSETLAPKMLSLIKVYLERGGYEPQINVVDQAALLSARSKPDSYRELLVRIGGYSDYFVRLTSTMQDEIIARTLCGY